MELKAKNLMLKYEDNTIFKNLSLSVAGGEILGVKGGNGSGKSSLALCLSGLIEEETGGVYFDGDVFYDDVELRQMSVKDRCENVGVIFQNPDNQLFSPLVIEELSFALENLAVKREIMVERIDSILRLMDIEHIKNKSTNSLSGGEKQLVAIASVFLMEPKILIVDEITSRIDMQRKQQIRQMLIDFASAGGAVVLISHSSKDLDIATRVIELERGKDYKGVAL